MTGVQTCALTIYGMILTTRDCNKRLYYSCNLYVISNEDLILMGEVCKAYGNELLSLHNRKADIIRIEYDGNIIWERSEYFLFKDAIASGRRMKLDTWYEFLELPDVLEELKVYNVAQLIKLSTDVCWLVEG